MHANQTKLLVTGLLPQKVGNHLLRTAVHKNYTKCLPHIIFLTFYLTAFCALLYPTQAIQPCHTTPLQQIYPTLPTLAHSTPNPTFPFPMLLHPTQCRFDWLFVSWNSQPYWAQSSDQSSQSTEDQEP